MANNHSIAFIFAFLLSLTAATPFKKDVLPYADNDANANDYMDELLTNVRELIIKQNMDPYTAIEYQFLNVHLTGDLEGLSTLRRAGPANLKFNQDDEHIEIDAVFGVNELKANLQWTTNLGFTNFNGYVSGTASEAVTNVTLRANLETKTVRITKFKVARIGKITVDTKTLPIPFWDRIVSLISGAVSNLLKNITARLLEGPIRGFVQSTIDKIKFEGLGS